VTKDELIRVIWVLLAVRLIDDIVVLIVNLLSLSVFLGCFVTLVVIAKEFDEFSAITVATDEVS